MVPLVKPMATRAHGMRPRGRHWGTTMATHVPSLDLQGPFTAKLSSGRRRRIASVSPTAFHLASQAQEWLCTECARLSASHPRRRLVGIVLNRQGAMCLILDH